MASRNFRRRFLVGMCETLSAAHLICVFSAYCAGNQAYKRCARQTGAAILEDRL